MKTVGAVVLAFIVIFVLVFVMFTGLYAMLGAENAFQPKSYAVSTQWVVISIALSFFAGMVGGAVAQKVGGDAAGIWICALLFLLGLAVAIPSLGAPMPPERTEDLGNMEAMAKAVIPTWMAFLNSFLGPVAAWLGASFIRRQSPS
jgi:hypothetical protein